VSVFGVLVFFWIIYDLKNKNNLVFQVNNRAYFFATKNLDCYKNSKETYFFYKYNFFDVEVSKYLYIFLDAHMIINLWKEYFIEYNLYIKPGIQVFELFDDFECYDVFADLENYIGSQWIPFCFLLKSSPELYFKVTKLRYIYGINYRYMKGGSLSSSNKVLFNMVLLLLREEHYKAFLKIDTSIFSKIYNYY